MSNGCDLRVIFKMAFCPEFGYLFLEAHARHTSPVLRILAYVTQAYLMAITPKPFERFRQNLTGNPK